METTLIKEDVKSILYCKSFLKGKKEQAMKTQFREIFEEGLKEVVASLTKKGSSKRYEKVLEGIGRLREVCFHSTILQSRGQAER